MGAPRDPRPRAARKAAHRYSDPPTRRSPATVKPDLDRCDSTGHRKWSAHVAQAAGQALLIEYSSASGTPGTPISYESARARNPSQKTWKPWRAAMRSRSSFMALTSTCRQKRSMARGVWRFWSNQSSMLIRSRSGRRGFPRFHSRRRAISARAIPSCRANPDRRRCQERAGEMQRRGQRPRRRTETRPPGSRKKELAVEPDALLKPP